MKKLAFNGRWRGRPAFTLVEVSLAAVAGSMLLASMAYTMNEMRKAVSGIINESYAQTVARDLQMNLDHCLNAMNKAGNQGDLKSPNFPPDADADKQMELYRQRMRFTHAKVNKPANPGGEQTTIQTGGGGSGQQEANDSALFGGTFEWSEWKGSSEADGWTEWRSTADIGSRGMFDEVYFTQADAPSDMEAAFKLSENNKNKLLCVTTKLNKLDMVPLYMQMVASPRTLKWTSSEDFFQFREEGDEFGDKDNDGTPNKYDESPLDPQVSTVVRYPDESNGEAAMAFEDNYPSAGDRDFNDIVTTFQMTETWGPMTTTSAEGVVTITDPAPETDPTTHKPVPRRDSTNVNARPALKEVNARFSLKARGAGYNADLRLRINEIAVGDGDVTISRYDADGKLSETETRKVLAADYIKIFTNTQSLMTKTEDGWSSNVTPRTTYRNPPYTTVKLRLDHPELNRWGTLPYKAPYDTYAYIYNTKQEIHRPMVDTDSDDSVDSYKWNFGSSKGTTKTMIDSLGSPWALLVPTTFAWPLEMQDIDVAYPQYKAWRDAKRPDVTDWYYYPQPNRYVNAAYNKNGQAAPSPKWDKGYDNKTLRDPDAQGRDRYLYVFDPRFFKGGVASYTPPSAAPSAGATTAVTAAPSAAPSASPTPLTKGDTVLSPIAIPESSLTNVSVGGPLGDLRSGTAGGNFAWLNWKGPFSESNLEKSLDTKPNSKTYVNPENSSDRELDAGDYVVADTNISNSSGLVDSLTKLKSLDIVVPLWKEGLGDDGKPAGAGNKTVGSNLMFRVSGFAKIRITNFSLNNKAGSYDKLNATFLGRLDSRGNPEYTVYGTPTPAPTPTPVPATPTPTATPRPASDDLAPFGLGVDLLAGKSVGSTLGDSQGKIYQGSSNGRFGWLAWDNDRSASRLAISLAVPGDSYKYTNPYAASDREINVGDYIWGSDSVSGINTTDVNNRLAYMRDNDVQIAVPVYDTTAGSGSNRVYRTQSFALLRITEYSVKSSTPYLKATFQGYCSNQGDLIVGSATPSPTPSPSATPTPSSTPTPTPTATPVTGTPKALLPIGINKKLIDDKGTNYAMSNLSAGIGDNNFAWLNWSNDGESASELRTSLALPGNANTYVNPSNSSDKVLAVGKKIYVSTTNLSDYNNSPNRAAVDAIQDREVTVPVFKTAGSGASSVEVTGFARIKVTSRALGQNPDRISVTYLRSCDINGN